MIDPFDVEDIPFEVLDEISSPNFDWGLEDDCAINGSIKHSDILKYQSSLSKSCKETVPTEATRVYWLYAESKKRKRKSGKNSGKWLIFLKPQFIDAAWEQVKYATENGLLGAQSKVSTKKGFKGDDYVICVYTYNWKDEKDVLEIREQLRELGFNKPLPYKADSDTLAGKYYKPGTKIAKYYE